jgi:hypothetical protein
MPQHGLQVSEELVRQVRFEMLKETTRVTAAGVPRKVPQPAVHRRPQEFPE